MPFCKICHLKFDNSTKLHEHMGTILHHQKLHTTYGEETMHKCYICMWMCSSIEDYTNHIRCETHIREVSKLKSIKSENAFDRNDHTFGNQERFNPFVPPDDWTMSNSQSVQNEFHGTLNNNNLVNYGEHIWIDRNPEEFNWYQTFNNHHGGPIPRGTARPNVYHPHQPWTRGFSQSMGPPRYQNMSSNYVRPKKDVHHSTGRWNGSYPTRWYNGLDWQDVDEGKERRHDDTHVHTDSSSKVVTHDDCDVKAMMTMSVDDVATDGKVANNVGKQSSQPTCDSSVMTNAKLVCQQARAARGVGRHGEELKRVDRLHDPTGDKVEGSRMTTSDEPANVPHAQTGLSDKINSGKLRQNSQRIANIAKVSGADNKEGDHKSPTRRDMEAVPGNKLFKRPESAAVGSDSLTKLVNHPVSRKDNLTMNKMLRNLSKQKKRPLSFAKASTGITEELNALFNMATTDEDGCTNEEDGGTVGVVDESKIETVCKKGKTKEKTDACIINENDDKNLMAPSDEVVKSSKKCLLKKSIIKSQTKAKSVKSPRTEKSLKSTSSLRTGTSRQHEDTVTSAQVSMILSQANTLSSVSNIYVTSVQSHSMTNLPCYSVNSASPASHPGTVNTHLRPSVNQRAISHVHNPPFNHSPVSTSLRPLTFMSTQQSSSSAQMFNHPLNHPNSSSHRPSRPFPDSTCSSLPHTSVVSPALYQSHPHVPQPLTDPIQEHIRLPLASTVLPYSMPGRPSDSQINRYQPASHHPSQTTLIQSTQRHHLATTFGTQQSGLLPLNNVVSSHTPPPLTTPLRYNPAPQSMATLPHAVNYTPVTIASNPVNSILNISLKEEDVRKDLAETIGQIESVRRLISEHIARLQHLEHKKQDLLRIEENLRTERMRILHAAVESKSKIAEIIIKEEMPSDTETLTETDNLMTVTMTTANESAQSTLTVVDTLPSTVTSVIPAGTGDHLNTEAVTYNTTEGSGIQYLGFMSFEKRTALRDLIEANVVKFTGEKKDIFEQLLKFSDIESQIETESMLSDESQTNKSKKNDSIDTIPCSVRLTKLPESLTYGTINSSQALRQVDCDLSPDGTTIKKRMKTRKARDKKKSRTGLVSSSESSDSQVKKMKKRSAQNTGDGNVEITCNVTDSTTTGSNKCNGQGVEVTDCLPKVVPNADDAPLPSDHTEVCRGAQTGSDVMKTMESELEEVYVKMDPDLHEWVNELLANEKTLTKDTLMSLVPDTPELSSFVKRRPRRSFVWNKDAIRSLIVCRDSIFVLYTKTLSPARFSMQFQHVITYDQCKTVPTCMMAADTTECLYIGCKECKLMALNIFSGRVQSCVPLGSSPTSLVHDPVTNKLYAGLASGVIVTYAIPRQQVVKAFQVACEAVTAMRVTNEGPRRLLCVASRDAVISLVHAASGLLIRSLTSHSHAPLSMHVLNSVLWSGGEDESLMAHDVYTGDMVAMKTDTKSTITGVELITVGEDRKLVVTSADGYIRLYNPQTHALECVYCSRDHHPITAVAVSGNKVYTGNEVGTIEELSLNAYSQAHLTCQSEGCDMMFSLHDDITEHFITAHAHPRVNGRVHCVWRGCGRVVSCDEADSEQTKLKDHVLSHLT